MGTEGYTSFHNPVMNFPHSLLCYLFFGKILIFLYDFDNNIYVISSLLKIFIIKDLFSTELYLSVTYMIIFLINTLRLFNSFLECIFYICFTNFNLFCSVENRFLWCNQWQESPYTSPFLLHPSLRTAGFSSPQLGWGSLHNVNKFASQYSSVR